MDAHELADVLARHDSSGRPYLEFIRVPDLSVGLYVLPAGGVDGQRPHDEDEVYYVLDGEARISVGDEDPLCPSGIGGLCGGWGCPSFPRHPDRAAAARLLRPGGVPHRLTASVSADANSVARPVSSWRKNTNTSEPAARNGSRRAAQAAISASA